MAQAYNKEFLVSAYISRFLPHCSIEQLVALEQNALSFYDSVGRDKFRQYASLDADAIKQYKALVVEVVDTLVLEISATRREGSSPS